jgi:5'-nucleotidase
MPRILVTNDDGVESPGLIALAEAFAALGEVVCVAPDSDRSGVSHSISVRHTVTVARVEGRNVPTYACSGMPADCVVLGSYEFFDGAPDLVVSGINRGANLADDISYSGTVGAAVEGLLVGAGGAIAVSLASSWPEVARVHNWDVAAAIAIDAARAMLAEPLPEGTFLNINVPNVTGAELKGVRYTRQGRKRYRDRLARTDEPDAPGFYWVWGVHERTDAFADADMLAVDEGYASISPLHVDRTNHTVLARLREQGALK